MYFVIAEQFTVKAHTALFEGEGEGGGGKGEWRGGAKKLRNTFPSKPKIFGTLPR